MKKLFQTLINFFKYRSIILGDVKIGSDVFIRYSIIKGNIEIANGASIFRVNLVGKISIGEKSSLVGPFTYIQSAEKPISIGDRCAIAPQTTIITGGHDRHVEAKSFSAGGKKTEGQISIGDDVWIGAGSIVVGNCEIESNVSIGAGSVLLGKNYGPNKFYAGVPAIEK